LTLFEQGKNARTLYHAPSAQQLGTTSLIIPSDLTLETVTYALATLQSYIMGAGLTAVLQQSDLDPSDMTTGGLAYLGQGLVTLSTGGSFELTKLPRIFDVLIALLSPKLVRIGPQSLRYTPNWGTQYEYPSSFTTSWGTVYGTVIPASGDFYNIIPGGFLGDSDRYGNFLKMCENYNSWGLSVVDYGKINGLYRRDPSAYARNYVYFGAAGPSAGLYSEAELEVPFYYPRWSKFVKYGTQDEVVSRVFTPQSGGISGPVALSLYAAGANPYAQLKTPYPIIYKFINLYDVVNVLVGWLIGVYNSTPANVQGDTIFTKPTQIPFSIKDFAWMIRQAILSFCPEQTGAQFVAPVEAIPSQNNSVFQPFIVDGCITPNRDLGNIEIPVFLNENLSMLAGYHLTPRQTPNSKKYGTTPKKLRHDFVPVWGVYSGDELPIPMFINDSGQEVPIFQTANVIPECRLSDGISVNNLNQKILVNSYLPSIKTAWNTLVSGFAKRTSTKVTPMNTDVNMRVSLLNYTRVLKKFDNDTLKTHVTKPLLPQPIDKYIANRPSLKKKAVPPATYYELYTYEILSHSPLDSTMVGALRNMVIPSIRFDYTGQDKLTGVAYSIYTTELCSTLNYTNQQAAQQEILRQVNVGLMCVQGLFGSNAENDELVATIDYLNSSGQGGSLITSLLGGLASMVPVVGPLLSDAISSM